MEPVEPWIVAPETRRSGLGGKTGSSAVKTSATVAKVPGPRKGMPPTKLSKADFTERCHGQFFDPAFDSLRPELNKIAAVAWENYQRGRKSPVTQKAGHAKGRGGFCQCRLRSVGRLARGPRCHGQGAKAA